MVKEKIFKTFEEQMEILKKRNLTFLHPRTSLKLLSQNNYYFLTGYKDLLLENKNPDYYKEGATFEELYALYIFDKKLKIIFLDLLLETEQNVKTTVAYEVTKQHGNKTNSYTDPKNYDNTNRYVSKTLSKVKKQLGNNGDKNRAIYHYKNTHGYVPLWVGVKIITFGVMHNLYSILKPSEKDYVARSLLQIDITPRRARTVDTYLHLLVDARNMCAHDEIFYNFLHGSIKIPENEYHKQFKLLKNKNNEIIQGRKDLFTLLIVMKHFVNRARYKKFINKINILINSHMKSVHSYSKEELLLTMHLPQNFAEIYKL